jgi:alpha-beta hydrolase superfamily lysophospholipase
MDESSDHYQSSNSGEELYRRVFTPRSQLPEEWRGGVLMVHGVGDHLGRHEKAARMFCRQGLVAAGLDWPGHGHSPGKRGHADGVDPLIGLIEESLADLRKRIPAGSPIGLYAHSAGAFVLLQFLGEQAAKERGATYPPSAFPFVWLSSPLLRPSHGQSLVKVKMGEWLSKVTPGLCLDTGVRPARCHPPDADTGLLKVDPLGHHKISLALGADILRRSRSIDDCALLFQQPTKLLITQGSADGICPPRFSQAFFENVPLPADDKTFLLLPGVLHEPLNDPGASELLGRVGDWVGASLNQQG